MNNVRKNSPQQFYITVERRLTVLVWKSKTSIHTFSIKYYWFWYTTINRTKSVLHVGFCICWVPLLIFFILNFIIIWYFNLIPWLWCRTDVNYISLQVGKFLCLVSVLWLTILWKQTFMKALWTYVHLKGTYTWMRSKPYTHYMVHVVNDTAPTMIILLIKNLVLTCRIYLSIYLYFLLFHFRE